MGDSYSSSQKEACNASNLHYNSKLPNRQIDDTCSGLSSPPMINSPTLRRKWQFIFEIAFFLLSEQTHKRGNIRTDRAGGGGRGRCLLRLALPVLPRILRLPPPCARALACLASAGDPAAFSQLPSLASLRSLHSPYTLYSLVSGVSGVFCPARSRRAFRETRLGLDVHFAKSSPV
jgi:hypothetical protein